MVRHLVYHPRGRKNVFFCWTNRFQVLQGMFVPSFAQIFEEMTAYIGPILS